MNTWTPIWSQIVDSTLWEEELPVRVLFLTMLALRDSDDVVRMPLRTLRKKANVPMEVLIPALKKLLSPDEKSMDYQPEEGRRLREVEGGWYIINAKHYREEMKRLHRRQYQAEWIRKKRAEIKGKPLPGEVKAIEAEERGDRDGAEAITTAALPVLKQKAEIAGQGEAGAAIMKGLRVPHGWGCAGGTEWNKSEEGNVPRGTEGVESTGEELVDDEEPVEEELE